MRTAAGNLGLKRGGPLSNGGRVITWNYGIIGMTDSGKRVLSLVVFLLLVIGGGISIGVVTAPGDWYAGLVKPSFNPPNWIFGPVWTVLYVCIAVAGWRVWSQSSDKQITRLWFLQLILNFLWSPTFFIAERTGLALVVISLLLITILAFVIRARPRDRLASALFVPYAVWVSFAALLNAAIFTLN